MLPLIIGSLSLLAVALAIYGAYLVKRERQSRMATLIRAMEQEAGLAETPLAPEDAPESGLLRRLKAFLPAAVMERYAEELLWAGKPNGMDASQFMSLKLILSVLLPAIVPAAALFRLGPYTGWAMLAAGVMGFVLPDVWLGGLLARRKWLVAEELPLFADLIAAAVSAGLPLTEAVRRVAADAPGLVAREFLRSVQEMAAGKPRIQAWRDLLSRLPGDDLRTVVTAIMQAEQYGTSVAEMLRYQVRQIRLFKQQEAQRLAQSTTVRMRIPMLILILVPFMILLLGPALLQIAQLLL